MKISNQKADGLNDAPILKAGYLLKKRRMVLLDVPKPNTFIRYTSDRRWWLFQPTRRASSSPGLLTWPALPALVDGARKLTSPRFHQPDERFPCAAAKTRP